jgi:hypothetical protein
MNQGNLLGFTRVRGIPAGESYPEIKVRYISATSYVLQGADVDWLLLTTSSSAVTITIPPELSVKNGAAVHFGQHGSGQLTVSAGSGVNLRTAGTAKTRAQYSVISIMKADPNNDLRQWYLFGDFASS